MESAVIGDDADMFWISGLFVLVGYTTFTAPLSYSDVHISKYKVFTTQTLQSIHIASALLPATTILDLVNLIFTGRVFCLSVLIMPHIFLSAHGENGKVTCGTIAAADSTNPDRHM
ncbi:hypothetical protein BKA66DRAFT_165583 [Pyrenochaeta sp. MPI-SDFR-AT-0127]|nr:hypothetical protein BKA66DRAFT_165583 [Pyrenochaeta sp. MPI-SDFR-AT-0127]